MTLGDKLKQIRKDKGYTLRDVEKATNNKISYSYLSKLENDDKKNPSQGKLKLLTSLYDISLSQLYQYNEYNVTMNNKQQNYIDFVNMILHIFYSYTRYINQEPFKSHYFKLIKLCVVDNLFNNVINDYKILFNDKVIESNINIHKLKYLSKEYNHIKIKAEFTRQSIYHMDLQDITIKKEKHIDCILIIEEVNSELKFKNFEKGSYRDYLFN